MAYYDNTGNMRGMSYGQPTPMVSKSRYNRPGLAEINANVQAGRMSNQQGSYQVGGYNTGSGSPYIAKPNNTKISQYYQQMNALQNKPQNYYQQAMTDINASGVFDPIMQNIKEQMGWAHPYGSSLGDQQLAQQVATVMAQQVSPYAQQLAQQAFQGNQNLINQAAGLYGQAQGLNQQGAIAQGSQWLQAQQLGQQANQWQQQFDRQQDWHNDAQQAQQNRPSGGGGTTFIGNTPWANGGYLNGGSNSPGSVDQMPGIAAAVSGGTYTPSWISGTGGGGSTFAGGTTGGTTGATQGGGGGWMSNYPSWTPQYY